VQTDAVDTTAPLPAAGRTYRDVRRVRLADLDAEGRVRLDAVARFLQDIAIDDVQETGWGAPEHLWFVRRIRIDVLTPLLGDTSIELVTWCSGVAAIAAGRRWSLHGDVGGRIEVDSVWIHLDADARPSRVGDFGAYGVAAGGRPVSTRLELPDPPAPAARRRWPLRSADVDLHGHVNNAVHWQAVEDALSVDGAFSVAAPLRAELDYRDPIDLGDDVAISASTSAAGALVGLHVGDGVKAVARVGPLPGAG
jgi:acyl-ACP thioesterase